MSENKKVNMEENENHESTTKKDIPEEFTKIVKDFYKDILLVFPEVKYHLEDSTIEFLQGKKDANELFQYCTKIYPERFFDILYQNEEIFDNNEINTNFLPNIEFKKLWNEEISDNTRKTIWKYLQLILFSVSSNLKNRSDFGDTEKLFEAIDEDEMKKKLEETMKEMSDMFEQNLDGEDTSSFMNSDDLPNPEDLQNHINGLMEGKLGRLAQEIANETAAEMDMDMEESSNVGDVFQKLMKNPGKLMGLVKNIGSKLDDKLKSGEIKESELMQEAADLMEKMKSMPGMKNMNKIFSKMGMPMGKNQKVSMNGMQARINQNMRAASQKERMLRKLEQRRKQREEKSKPNTQPYKQYKFKPEEGNVEKSIRENPKKKKKKKKKKNKK